MICTLLLIYSFKLVNLTLIIRKFWNFLAQLIPTILTTMQYFEGHVEFGSIAQVFIYLLFLYFDLRVFIYKHLLIVCRLILFSME